MSARWILLLTALVVAIVALERIDAARRAVADPPALALHFLDVGKGDAVLIQTADGRAVLYDGGDGRLRVLSHLRRLGVRSLELVIASHHHGDHTGGLAEVIRQYRPRYIMDNGVPRPESWAYGPFMRAVSSVPAEHLPPARQTIRIGDVELHVLPPPGDTAWGQNDNSIGLIVELGDFRASLLGDSEHRQQQWWLQQHGDVIGDVAVHKASHHGWIRGDSPQLIARLRPEIVVLDVGASDDAQPADSLALDHYRAVGARLYHTSLHGTVSILVDRDGDYEVRTERRASLASGARPLPLDPRGSRY